MQPDLLYPFTYISALNNKPDAVIAFESYILQQDYPALLQLLTTHLHSDYTFVKACIVKDLSFLLGGQVDIQPSYYNIMHFAIDDEQWHLVQFLMIDCDYGSEQERYKLFHRHSCFSLLLNKMMTASPDKQSIILRMIRLYIQYNDTDISVNDIHDCIRCKCLPLLQIIEDTDLSYENPYTHYTSFEIALISQGRHEVLQFIEERIHRTQGEWVVFHSIRRHSWLFLLTYEQESYANVFSMTEALDYLMNLCGEELLLIKDAQGKTFLHAVSQIFDAGFSFQTPGLDDLLTKILFYYKRAFINSPEKIDTSVFFLDANDESPLYIACNGYNSEFMLAFIATKWMNPTIASKITLQTPAERLMLRNLHKEEKAMQLYLQQWPVTAKIDN